MLSHDRTPRQPRSAVPACGAPLNLTFSQLLPLHDVGSGAASMRWHTPRHRRASVPPDPISGQRISHAMAVAAYLVRAV
jgi:hypothetical protein